MKTCNQDSLSEPNVAPYKCKAEAMFSEEPGDVEIQNEIFDTKRSSRSGMWGCGSSGLRIGTGGGQM
jgi:hypothetical protein